MNPAFWAGKRVFITGHTGFKGSWLASWLSRAGADVCGYALDPPTTPSLFVAADVGRTIRDLRGDVRDLNGLTNAIRDFAPEVVFHLAAQALVLASHRHPVDTYAINVMGTVHVLEAMRSAPSVRVCVVVTSDKCYDGSSGRGAPHKESDSLGGADPYSSSKACAELVTAAYRDSFFKNGPGIATVRAGNVIGGGDWADDRLVPDLIRSFRRGEMAVIRNPSAIRPWQHVLEPLSGYLRLAERLWDDNTLAGAWNFGPAVDDERTVEAVVEQVGRLWGRGASWRRDERAHPVELMTLRLDATKARDELQWKPRLDLSSAIERTVAWYSAFETSPDSARQLVETDLEHYEALA